MKAMLLGTVFGAMLVLPASAGGDVAIPQSGAPQSSAEAAARPDATATIRGATGQKIGYADLTQTPDGVLIDLHADSLPPGVHAVHIHAAGKCEPGTHFASAGGHFNPSGKEHGKLDPKGPHAGDMDNQTVDANGELDVKILNPNVTLGPGPNSLFDDDGSAIVIHAGADDYMSQPAGNAGDRIACGVIARRPIEPE